MRRSACLCLLLATSGAYAQTASSLSFSLDRDGPPPQHYRITLDQATGRGVYQADPAAGASANAARTEHTLSVAPPVLERLFAAVPIVKADRCESHIKNVARTGQKTLHFIAGGAAAECTYNYSNEDRVNTATSLFEALAETLQSGDRLASDLRFDRLGLDAELDNLQSALHDGRAIEVANISPVLVQIENNERVMERVQRKAARLLEAAGVPAVQPSGSTASPGFSDR